MEKLRRQVALVTGGTRGMGRAIVDLFLAEGASVMSCSRSPEANEVVLAEIRQKFGEEVPLGFCQTDTADVEQIQHLVDATLQRFGAPAILINNAASNLQRHTAETELDEFARTINTNVRGYWYLARLLYPHMTKLGTGSIVNVASTQAYQTHRSCFPYNVSKGVCPFPDQGDGGGFWRAGNPRQHADAGIHRHSHGARLGQPKPRSREKVARDLRLAPHGPPSHCAGGSQGGALPGQR